MMDNPAPEATPPAATRSSAPTTLRWTAKCSAAECLFEVKDRNVQTADYLGDLHASMHALFRRLGVEDEIHTVQLRSS